MEKKKIVSQCSNPSCNAWVYKGEGLKHPNGAYACNQNCANEVDRLTKINNSIQPKIK
jgi:hypothetical protein